VVHGPNTRFSDTITYEHIKHNATTGEIYYVVREHRGRYTKERKEKMDTYKRDAYERRDKNGKGFYHENDSI
jgi:hypothetical protein